jgi:hypothetical protein
MWRIEMPPLHFSHDAMNDAVAQLREAAQALGDFLQKTASSKFLVASARACCPSINLFLSLRSAPEVSCLAPALRVRDGWWAGILDRLVRPSQIEVSVSAIEKCFYMIGVGFDDVVVFRHRLIETSGLFRTLALLFRALVSCGRLAKSLSYVAIASSWRPSNARQSPAAIQRV